MKSKEGVEEHSNLVEGESKLRNLVEKERKKRKKKLAVDVV